jgi:hypothetical protein
MFNKVLIKANHIGLVYRNEKLVSVLQAGRHFIGFGNTCEAYDMANRFASDKPLNYLLQHTELAEMLHVWELADHEIGLLYRDGNYLQVLTAGIHAYWKGADVFSLVRFDTSELRIDASLDINLIKKGHLNQYVQIQNIEQWEQGVLYVNGQMECLLPPGKSYFWQNKHELRVYKADMRVQNMDITGQEMLTRDKAQVRVSLSVQYRISDLLKSLSQSRDADKQLYLQVQLMVRTVIGQLTLDELLEYKDKAIAQAVADARVSADDLGIGLVHIGIKDIILPGDVKEIMHQVLVAEKRAQANVIMRREETASMRSMLNTAKLMEENAMLMKLKEMEYVEKIAEKIHTISVSGGGQIADQLKQLFVK